MAWNRETGLRKGLKTSTISGNMKAFNTGGKSLVSQAYPATTTTGYDLKLSNPTSGGRSGGGGANANYNSLLGAAGLYGYKNNMLQDLYNRQKGALSGAYDEYLGALADNLNSTKSALYDAYSRSKQAIMSDARNSMKQAYINRVLQEKNLDQSLAAQGLSGGATETTKASMSNNYGNARNEIDRTRNNNLSTLEGEYNQNLAAAMQAYNSAVAQANLQRAQQEMELEEALVNGQMDALENMGAGFGDDGSYIAALQMALNNGSNYEWTPTEANNAVQALELQMGGGADTRLQNNILAALQAIMGSGNKNMAAALQNPMTQNYLNAILQQLQGAR